MRFSILHTFHQISHTFDFWNDLDLAGDLDLWLKVTKKICTIPGMYLAFVPKMKVIQPLVLEEFGHRQTHTQTEDLRLL